MESRFAINILAVAVVGAILIMPTRAAAQGSSQISHSSAAQSEAILKEAAAKPTPRTKDGHPDLNGSWTYPQYEKSAHQDADGNLYINVPSSNGGQAPRTDLSVKQQLTPRRDPNPPPYKPELLEKVKQLAEDEVHTDPAFHCKPLGVPRVGPPAQILQTAKLTIFLYQIDAGIGDQTSFRLIPTDGRPHRTDVDPSYFGDSIGHWEGDTLVVDVNHLSDETWLAGGDDGSGYFHSDALHVVERYTRKGNTLRWEATAEDPQVLTRPWVITPQTEVLTDTMVYEQPICEERETSHIVNKY